MSCWALEVDWAAVGSMFQGVSAIVAAGAALVGLNAWRRQLKATRHQVLAEDALSLVYRLRDAIDHMRHPWAFTAEMRKVERGESESEEDFERRRHFGVIEVRYQVHAESAAQLEAIRYRVRAVLGQEAAAGVEDVLTVLRRVRNEAANAVHRQAWVLKQAALLGRFPSDQNEASYDNALRKLKESESWIQAGDEGDDPAAAELKNAVNRAEAALRDFAMMEPKRSSS